MKDIEEKIKELHDVCPAIDGGVIKKPTFIYPKCKIELELVEDSYPCKKCGADWVVVSFSMSLGDESG